MRLIRLAAVLVLTGLAVPLHGQTELDRIVARVNGSVVTRSDVRQAKLLKLVPDVSSDEATQRGLEDRLLMLGEVSRAPIDPITDADVASRRRQWETTLGGASAAALLGQAGMSEAALMAWFKDDLKISANTRRQFGNIAEVDRPRAMADWVARLRRNAGLK